MIGMKYANSNDRIMEDRIADNAGGDSDLTSSESGIEESSGPSKKPSLLRSQLLRRTTTRTKKRSQVEASITTTDENYAEPSTTQDATVNNTESTSSKHTNTNESHYSTTTAHANDSNPKTLEIVDGNSGNDNTKGSTRNDDRDFFQFQHVHHNAECEIKSSSKSNTSNDKHNDLDVSEIESDEGESKSEEESNRLSRMKRAQQQTTATAATVSTSNLSIVVTGNDIVVEYRDDNRGAGSSLSQKQPSTRRRPRGIMKRPRDSNITYHHPRRPLPPPLPPPGYRESSSPMSWMTATTADSSDSSARQFLNAPPTAITTSKKKRVSFDEKMLMKQYNSARLRRQAKHEQRRSLSGIVSMAMPVIMPYLIAILILVASSMIPLPTAQRQQQPSLSLSLEQELVDGREKKSKTKESRLPTSPPILVDVGSRMWDKRTKSKEAARAMSAVDNDGASVMTARGKEAVLGYRRGQEGISAAKLSELTATAVLDGSSLPSDGSMGLEIVGVDSSKKSIAVAHRFELVNPIAKTMASFFKILRAILSPFHR
jgi:hypothetical protein